MTKARQRKCKWCDDWYTPIQSLSQVCSYPCAIEHGKVVAAKRERRLRLEAKRKIKTRGEWTSEAQASFNKFVRSRDKDLPCISCGRFHEGQWHAGHYRTTAAAPELRFDENNCHRQCQPCNTHKSGDIVNYRINLIARIGREAVEALEGPHEPKKYTIEDLQGIKRDYRFKLKQLNE